VYPSLPLCLIRMKDELLNLYGCANRLKNISAGWLKEKALSGEIPCIRVGKRQMYFDLAAVKKAIKELASCGGSKQAKKPEAPLPKQHIASKKIYNATDEVLKTL